ncbi:MAG: hypothetical protein RLZZ436_4230 [Planctomycetota bacterium]|jgi:hypothetical protein
MLSTSFPDYVTALEAAGFGAWHEDSSAEVRFASLFVVFHIDDDGRKYVLQAFDARELARSLDPVGGEFPLGLLQLTFQYPFDVQETSFPDIARWLHRLNNLLPIGSFLLSEDDQCICHRSTVPAGEAGLPSDVLVEMVGIIRRFCVDLAGAIEAVATGKMSYQEVLSELTQGDG